MLAIFRRRVRPSSSPRWRGSSRAATADFARVEPAVREILAAVRAERRRRGPALQRALRAGARRASSRATTRAPPRSLACRPRRAPRWSSRRRAIRAFHERERDVGLPLRRRTGSRSASASLPVAARAGVYAPGGKARYPSSVLMSAVPARVAGVKEIILATPLAGDESRRRHLRGGPPFRASPPSSTPAARRRSRALAYGTESVPRVDKIVGPGNLYVACAKRLVFGAVDIDGIAGPSEILVVADDEADPRIIAADLLSQAEHDEAAYPLLVCASDLMAAAVRARARDAARDAAASGHRRGPRWQTARRSSCALARADGGRRRPPGRRAPRPSRRPIPRRCCAASTRAGAVFSGR